MIVFRLDANEKIATGHMYRCISIAKECIKRGEECIFLVAKGGFTEPLEKAGMTFEELDLNPENWDEGIEVLIEKLREVKASLLVVDSYKVTANFFEKVSREINVFYLDDLCKESYNLKAALHYSEFEDEDFIGKIYAGTDVKTYRGTRFVPLRSEFSQGEIDNARKYDILITTGGSDTYHITKILLGKITSDERFSDSKICAILGKLNLDDEEIKNTYSENENVTILQNISNMGEVMNNCKYAVTAAGITVYELMASGVLPNVFAFSEDQVFLGERLKERNISFYSGDARVDAEAVAESLKNNLYKLISSGEEKRIIKARENLKIADGKGSGRIADILVGMC